MTASNTFLGLARRYAATIDAESYAGEGQQSLEFTSGALGDLMQASIEQGSTLRCTSPCTRKRGAPR